LFSTKHKMKTLVLSRLAWNKLEPMYVSIYKESFTEEEVAGIVAFYKTPAGQAVINKLPTLLQKTMAEVQKIIADLTPQLQQIQQDSIAETKAASY